MSDKRHTTAPSDDTLPAAAAPPAQARAFGPVMPSSLVGAAIGRFVLLERLGEGGMGVVYKARDEVLDRPVAVKLLRSPSPAAQQRLLREAQALARLSHPHVVTVYEAGAHGHETFIAMEYVDGTTLAGWLARRPPPPAAEVLRMFVAAGRGLAAAHAAGLVHRDFKPSNVLVGRDGRARVADFGIVAASASGGDSPPLPPTLEATMTGTGGLVGTPAYMAPEQARGQEVDARCDQFSFCVALYEALAGTRPFPGDDLPAVLARIERGELAPPRERPPVPGRVMRALRRGLAAAPAARFPSMDALLDALAPSRGRRVALGAAAAVTLAVAAVGGARLLAPAPAGPAPCTGFEALLGGVWDAPRRARVEARFGASEQAFAAEAFTRAAGRLDAYAAAWVRARGEACAATRVRGDQSEALLDARVRCLDGRRAELDRAAWVLEHADAPTMSRAVDVAAGLTDLERCADARALAQRLPPPRDPLARAKITAVEARLAEVKALLEARDWGHAVALSEPLLADAEALTWPPLVASALYHHAGALQGIGRYQEAAALYERAALTAERAGDDRLRFLALVYQADTRGYFLSDRPAATRLEREARALLERLDDDPELRAILLERLANIELHFGDLDRAKALALEQLELRRDRLGADDLVLARAYLLVGRVLEIRNELDEAERHLLRAQELFARVFGAEHPGLTSIWHALAIVYKERGELVKAEALQKKIIAVEVPLWGADNDKIGRTMHNLGATLRLLGKHDESRLVLERSLAIKIAVDGEDGLWTATTRTNLAETLLELGRFDEAAAQLERARDSEARHTDRGPSPYTTALLGVAEVRRGHRTKGLELLDAAVAAARRQVAEPLELAAALALRGPVLLDLGRAAAARADLEEALAILQRGPAPPQDHAELEFGLARALDASGGDRRRAVALARRALERLEHADAPDAKREAIRRWLATR